MTGRQVTFIFGIKILTFNPTVPGCSVEFKDIAPPFRILPCPPVSSRFTPPPAPLRSSQICILQKRHAPQGVGLCPCWMVDAWILGVGWWMVDGGYCVQSGSLLRPWMIVNRESCLILRTVRPIRYVRYVRCIRGRACAGVCWR